MTITILYQDMTRTSEKIPIRYASAYPNGAEDLRILYVEPLDGPVRHIQLSEVLNFYLLAE